MSMFSTDMLRILFISWLVQLAEPRVSRIPGEEVIATLGQPVLLSCRLDKPFDPREHRVYWQGRQPSDTLGEYPKVLHAYNKGKEELDKQDSHYKNRTSIFRDLIPRGNLSLLISEAKAKDDNTQIIVHVQICQTGETLSICRKRLRVTARFQKPELKVSCKESTGELEIACTSHGGFPKPNLTWTGLGHQDSNPLVTVTPSQNDSTYSIRSEIRVNLTKDQTVTCYITNLALQETVNTSITPRDTCSGPAPSTKHVVIFTVVLVIVFVGCAIVILQFKRKGKVCDCPNQRRGAHQVPTENSDEEPTSPI